MEEEEDTSSIIVTSPSGELRECDVMDGLFSFPSKSIINEHCCDGSNLGLVCCPSCPAGSSRDDPTESARLATKYMATKDYPCLLGIRNYCIFQGSCLQPHTEGSFGARSIGERAEAGRSIRATNADHTNQLHFVHPSWPHPSDGRSSARMVEAAGKSPAHTTSRPMSEVALLDTPREVVS